MKLADKISYELQRWVKSSGYDVVIPNFYHGLWEMDVFKLTNSGIITEFEIKISRSDFKNDFEKKRFGDNKHSKMIDKSCACNRFYFVVPQGLIGIEEIPQYAGLIYFKSYGSFETIKTAPLIHKNKPKDMVKFYKNLCCKLAFRETLHKNKLRAITRQYSALKKTTYDPINTIL